MNLSLPRLPLALAAAATIIGADRREPPACGHPLLVRTQEDAAWRCSMGSGGNSWREITRAAAAQEAGGMPERHQL